MIKSFKVRLYPTKSQEQLMWQHIGACRFIWNYMLDLQQKRRENGEKHLTAFSMINQLKPLKNDGEHGWLYDVSNTSCQIICQDLAGAYEGFFKKRSRFPKFKSRKHSKPNYPARAESMYFSDGFVHIEKLGKVKFKTDFNLPVGKGHKFTNPRISNVLGKWMLSFGMECESQVLTLTDKSTGIDLGLKETAVVAYGDEQIFFHNINKSKRVRTLKRQLRRTQRSISRKYESSKKRTGRYEKTKNIEREEFRLRKLHHKIANIRSNYNHQLTHALISMRPKNIVMEDLNVAGMMKNRHLSKAIAEQCFNEIRRMMAYKAEWSGIPISFADRFYASSKTCSNCGQIKHDLKLSDRIYKCDCGFEVDRDYNAALNLSRCAA